MPVLLLNGIGVFGWTFLEVTGGMGMGCWAGRRAGGIFDVVPHFIWSDSFPTLGRVKISKHGKREQLLCRRRRRLLPFPERVGITYAIHFSAGARLTLLTTQSVAPQALVTSLSYYMWYRYIISHSW